MDDQATIRQEQPTPKSPTFYAGSECQSAGLRELMDRLKLIWSVAPTENLKRKRKEPAKDKRGRKRMRLAKISPGAGKGTAIPEYANAGEANGSLQAGNGFANLEDAAVREATGIFRVGERASGVAGWANGSLRVGEGIASLEDATKREATGSLRIRESNSSVAIETEREASSILRVGEDTASLEDDTAGESSSILQRTDDIDLLEKNPTDGVINMGAIAEARRSCRDFCMENADLANAAMYQQSPLTEMGPLT